tara:strand:- start:83 stop:577 length:495 start_codon:yes stop_codon:yes gene_type:complete
MIIKIENVEQEKYVLECAEKDGFNWKHSKATGLSYYESDDIVIYYNNFLLWDFFTDLTEVEKELYITFEQFKAQRAEENLSDLANESLFYIQEKEIKELKKKLREIELHVNISIEGFGDIKINKGYQMALNDIKKLFQTPEQKEATEIIKNSSPEVLEELKKLL